MQHNLPTLDIIGTEVANVRQSDALSFIYKQLETNSFTVINYLNAHCANVAQRDQTYQKVLGDCTVLPDGIGVDVAARIIHGKKFEANLNGTDFTPLVLTSAPKTLKIALYGAAPTIAQKAAQKLSALDTRHNIRVLGHGFINDAEQEEMLVALSDFQPDILLVALGVPNQELWIHEHIKPEHCTIVFGVGALFDFLANNVKRAPEWARNLRIEWIYRLMQEPARLWRRYILGNPLFILHVLRYKFFAQQRRNYTK
ncbi:WecB/TagA/CpsF family glycosyltransferase [Ahrensia marina]|uniref:UDP-N-acetyl-D-mannosaminuronic acid transferase n=1 Tax=Ahrensia marina TaxID=1514904 RepID=A0A0N1J6K2_9HYPH|nr:WecB/TagA/CpsF family glycosyltransferase [Ahrensia marina]KPB02501.1 UDP-N-acetyl-D-mannosaminuronic acid transferase [Ahrensia marina]